MSLVQDEQQHAFRALGPLEDLFVERLLAAARRLAQVSRRSASTSRPRQSFVHTLVLPQGGDIQYISRLAPWLPQARNSESVSRRYGDTGGLEWLPQSARCKDPNSHKICFTDFAVLLYLHQFVGWAPNGFAESGAAPQMGPLLGDSKLRQFQGRIMRP